MSTTNLEWSLQACDPLSTFQHRDDQEPSIWEGSKPSVLWLEEVWGSNCVPGSTTHSNKLITWTNSIADCPLCYSHFLARLANAQQLLFSCWHTEVQVSNLQQWSHPSAPFPNQPLYKYFNQTTKPPNSPTTEPTPHTGAVRGAEAVGSSLWFVLFNTTIGCHYQKRFSFSNSCGDCRLRPFLRIAKYSSRPPPT